MLDILRIFRCFRPKYWKTYYSQIINAEDLASVKLGCNDKYYVEVYVYRLDSIMYIGKYFDTIKEAIQAIRDTEMENNTYTSNEIHPLINPKSKHYESNGHNKIFDIEKKLSVAEMIGAAKFNVEKYDFRKDKKGQKEDDLVKLETYSNYLGALQDIQAMLHESGENMHDLTVFDAMNKLNLTWSNWKGWKNGNNR